MISDRTRYSAPGQSIATYQFPLKATTRSHALRTNNARCRRWMTIVCAAPLAATTSPCASRKAWQIVILAGGWQIAADSRAEVNFFKPMIDNHKQEYERLWIR
ncbi:hypothetical protein ACLK19_20545 [Escherichia coli]